MADFDSDRWGARLTELAKERGVPGASLAVLVDGQVHTAVTGVLNIETGVEVTHDALFRIGSTAKVFTATAIMRLVEAGKVDLDAPIIEVLRDFRVADPEVTRRVTPRHLLSHTSGIAGDVLMDVGCGDDAVERFVEWAVELGQDVPLGAIQSYSNTGFVILGRIMERLTDQAWDEALRDLVLEPIGLEHTVTRFEALPRFRAACGHVGAPGSLELEPRMPTMRGMSPAGSTMSASASDVVAFGHVFLNGGIAENGERILSADGVAEMLRPQATVPAPRPDSEFYGLGWALFEWSGRRVIEHGGSTFGQRTSFEMVPDRRVAIALLTNARNQFADELYEELLRELCDMERPRPLEPPADGGLVDAGSVAGRYERFGVFVEVEARNGGLGGTEGLVEPLKSQFPQMGDTNFELRSAGAGAGLYFAREDGRDAWEPLAIREIGGQLYMHKGGRAHRRVG